MNIQHDLTELLVQRLSESKEDLKKQFNASHPMKVARHLVLDNLLPVEIAEKIYAEFPRKNKMRLLNSFGELKLRFSLIKNTSSLIQAVHYAIQDTKVVSIIEEITGIKNQIPDPWKEDGGVSMLQKGHFINPHLDRSHDKSKKFYRTVNLLYYVSPNWKTEYGGNYELWDEAVENRIVVPNLFNRLVVMETNTRSWHAVNPVTCHQARCCIFNYFFSQVSPLGHEYYHDAKSVVFKGRPDRKLSRALINFRNLFKTK